MPDLYYFYKTLKTDELLKTLKKVEEEINNGRDSDFNCARYEAIKKLLKERTK